MTIETAKALIPKGSHEEMWRLLELDLTRDSLAVMIGSYKGLTAHIISEAYGCRMMCYDPQKVPCQKLRKLKLDNVEIFQYDEIGDPTFGCKLIDAYPQFISPLAASWASQEVHRANVTWTYKYYEDFILKPGHSDATIERGNFFNPSGIGAGISTIASHVLGKLGQRATTAIGAASSVAGALGLFN